MKALKNKFSNELRHFEEMAKKNNNPLTHQEAMEVALCAAALHFLTEVEKHTDITHFHKAEEAAPIAQKYI